MFYELDALQIMMAMINLERMTATNESERKIQRKRQHLRTKAVYVENVFLLIINQQILQAVADSKEDLPPIFLQIFFSTVNRLFPCKTPIHCLHLR